MIIKKRLKKYSKSPNSSRKSHLIIWKQLITDWLNEARDTETKKLWIKRTNKLCELSKTSKIENDSDGEKRKIISRKISKNIFNFIRIGCTAIELRAPFRIRVSLWNTPLNNNNLIRWTN